MFMNRVQFQTGLSIPGFIQQFSAEGQCETALIQTAVPGTITYGHCVMASKGRQAKTGLSALALKRQLGINYPSA